MEVQAENHANYRDLCLTSSVILLLQEPDGRSNKMMKRLLLLTERYLLTLDEKTKEVRAVCHGEKEEWEEKGLFGLAMANAITCIWVGRPLAPFFISFCFVSFLCRLTSFFFSKKNLK